MRQNVQGPFRQVLSKEQSQDFVPVSVWFTEVSAKDIPSVLAAIKQHIPADPVNLPHIKRIVKLDGDHANVMVHVMISSHEAASKASIEQALPQREIMTATASRYQADTKEEAAEWSKTSWPIMWRGNLSAILPDLDEETRARMKSWVEKLKPDYPQLSRDVDTGHKKPCWGAHTLVVDPKSNSLISSGSSGNLPLEHGTMLAIEKAARTEALRREDKCQTSPDVSEHADAPGQNYLLTDLEVYTTNEPCTMCAMGLVHSRIGRLVYVTSDATEGAIEPDNSLGYGLHAKKKLNHTYEAWKYEGMSPNS